MQNETYSRNIKRMASSLDLDGKMPNIYCDEFGECVGELLLKEIESLDVKGVGSYLPLIDRDKKTGQILHFLSKFVRETDECIKKGLAIKICNIIAENVILYFRQEIEDDVYQSYNRYYN